MKLNLGCGDDVRTDDWVNMDAYYEHPNVVKHDMTNAPWPFANETFDEVFASHVFEHIPYLYPGGKDVLYDIMDECARVLKPGGVLNITGPFGHTQAALVCEQHYRQFFPDSFDGFCGLQYMRWVAKPLFRKLDWERRWSWRGYDSQKLPYSLRMGPSRLPLTTHLLVRFPVLKPLLMTPSELVIRLQKV